MAVECENQSKDACIRRTIVSCRILIRNSLVLLLYIYTATQLKFHGVTSLASGCQLLDICIILFLLSSYYMRSLLFTVPYQIIHSSCEYSGIRTNLTSFRILEGSLSTILLRKITSLHSHPTSYLTQIFMYSILCVKLKRIIYYVGYVVVYAITKSLNNAEVN